MPAYLPIAADYRNRTFQAIPGRSNPAGPCHFAKDVVP
jgi:hypothetical protein